MHLFLFSFVSLSTCIWFGNCLISKPNLYCTHCVFSHPFTTQLEQILQKLAHICLFFLLFSPNGCLSNALCVSIRLFSVKLEFKRLVHFRHTPWDLVYIFVFPLTLLLFLNFLCLFPHHQHYNNKNKKKMLVFCIH